jgi:hypothetical protein
MSISKFRNWLYCVTRFLGDIEAMQRGHVGKRIGRRSAGRFTGSLLSKLFK